MVHLSSKYHLKYPFPKILMEIQTLNSPWRSQSLLASSGGTKRYLPLYCEETQSQQTTPRPASVGRRWCCSAHLWRTHAPVTLATLPKHSLWQGFNTAFWTLLQKPQRFTKPAGQCFKRANQTAISMELKENSTHNCAMNHFNFTCSHSSP